MKLVTVAEMQAIEKEANARGLSYAAMVEYAGKGLAAAIQQEYPGHQPTGVLGLVGSGNNGADTLVALETLAQQGWPVAACLVRPRLSDDPLVARVQNAGGVVWTATSDTQFAQLHAQLAAKTILLDGILGTGLHLPIREDLSDFLRQVRRLLEKCPIPPQVVAVDCPSGIDCDSGEAAPDVISAHLTVTMAAIKQGLLKFPAYAHVGKLMAIGIGLPQEGDGLPIWNSLHNFIPQPADIRQWLPKRPQDAHKGTFGTALIVAGSRNYTGAALLAGEAAYRSGAGLVTLAVPYSLHPALAGHLPEATWLPLPELDGVIAEAAADTLTHSSLRPTSMLIGPGFGLEPTSGDFLLKFLRQGFATRQHHQTTRPAFPPLVIDADGLKLLTRIAGWHELLPPESILTPHPGEMSVLTGLSTAAIQADRLAVARQYSRLWNQVVVLKGAFTVVAGVQGENAVISVATPALARAGSGDVLAGMIAGLLAQGMPPFLAATTAAWIHAQAGLAALNQLGTSACVLPRDILAALPAIFRQFTNSY